MSGNLSNSVPVLYVLSIEHFDYKKWGTECLPYCSDGPSLLRMAVAPQNRAMFII